MVSLGVYQKTSNKNPWRSTMGGLSASTPSFSSDANLFRAKVELGEGWKKTEQKQRNNEQKQVKRPMNYIHTVWNNTWENCMFINATSPGALFCARTESLWLKSWAESRSRDPSPWKRTCSRLAAKLFRMIFRFGGFFVFLLGALGVL